MPSMPNAPLTTPLRIDAATGLLAGARQVLSPHFDQRPAGVLPQLVVVHGISLPPGQVGGPWIDRLFTGALPADQRMGGGAQPLNLLEVRMRLAR